MSQPKRYKFFKHIDYKLMEIDARMVEWSDGNWVDYSDYAALAAENERLRKAGDAMYHTAQQDGTGLWLHKSFQNWRDAK